MDTELIHEECKWLVSIFLPQLLQIWDECVSFDGRSVDLDELHTTLSWHGSYHWPISRVDVLLVDVLVVMLYRPVFWLDTQLGEINFVQEYQLAVLRSGTLQVCDAFSSLEIILKPDMCW
jgi:hypothetical protein